MSGGRWRERVRPWSLDRAVWEPRLGERAWTTYRAESWLMVSTVVSSLLLAGILIARSAGATTHDAVFWLSQVIVLSLTFSVLGLARSQRVVDRGLGQRYGMWSAHKGGLRNRHLRDPELFDRWVAESTPPRATVMAPPTPAPPPSGHADGAGA